MVRSKRVLSFMSEWGGQNSHHHQRSTSASVIPSQSPPSPSAKGPNASTISVAPTLHDNFNPPSSPTSPARPDSRPSSRPMSMIQTYQPPMMDVSQDVLPELQRIFTFVNNHSNKLYQEGYFLKFHDTDARGRPAADRAWQECFAQLVGTVLSLWDASELDRVGSDVEVLPTFINLSDAAIHMMPSMVLGDGKKLENILSVSTAASNKYLFHFNSFNSLTQWSAGIRLAMFEHASLQEAYTGALIAGKGKQLNNIRILLDRQRAKYEDWVRVRFGAGMPWRRCWCVVNPPDEKEFAKLQKLQKKKDIYDRASVVLKGDIRFYDSKKVAKKTRPIASVTDAYSCFAIYPQSKQLIDQSTLIKMEGKITIHSTPEKVIEGFVFVMPEARPAVSGFEIMLQYLFPVFDTFALYGRPSKLIADSLDARGLMFAMPSGKRWGYLEMWDIVSLIHSEGSQAWSEREWRKQLKDLTSQRMVTPSRDSVGSRPGTRRSTMSRTSMTTARNGAVRFNETGSVRSQPATRQTSPVRNGDLAVQAPTRVDSAPPAAVFATPRHQRSQSEQSNVLKKRSSRLAQRPGDGRRSPPASTAVADIPSPPTLARHDSDTSDEPISPQNLPDLQIAPTELPRGPVASPPLMEHGPSQKPPMQPSNPAFMKPNTQLDSATLEQLADATNRPLPPGVAAAGAAAAWRSGQSKPRYHQPYTNGHDSPGDQYGQSRRLPTIPASPYVEQEHFMDASSSAYEPAPPPVPEHAELPRTISDDEFVMTSPVGGGLHVQRKPVASQLPVDELPGSPRNELADPGATDHLVVQPAMLRQVSGSSSFYSNEDTLSTDYASTLDSDQASASQSRMALDGTHTALSTFPTSSSPSLGSDYARNLDRPNTGNTMTQTVHNRAYSRSSEQLVQLRDEQRGKLSSGRSTPTMALHVRGSSTSLSSQSDGRSIPWQPGMASPKQNNKFKLNPEDWVAHRASSPQRMLAHNRSKSSTPPLSRNQSGDWTQRNENAGPVRPPSRPISRPASRGAEYILDQRPTSLSAREQEQIARMTNTPLIDLSKSSRPNQRPSSTSLTGYIDAREKEKAASKPSRSTAAAMQAEIDRRMQAAQQRQMLEMQHMGNGSMMMPLGGGGGNHSPMMYGPPQMQPQHVMALPQGYTPAFAYSTPTQMQQMFHQQQEGYFPQRQQGQQSGGDARYSMYAAPQQQQGQPQQPVTQPYGASFDQAQAAAAARFAHGQAGGYRR